ncbi:MAG: hypothetical protein AB7E31_00030 [Desulfitobacterium sp.]
MAWSMNYESREFIRMRFNWLFIGILAVYFGIAVIGSLAGIPMPSGQVMGEHNE